MGKHSQETKTPRRHAFVEKAPVLAAMIIAGIGLGALLVIATWVNMFIKAAVDSYPVEGLLGYIIGAAVVLLLYKWWFKPEFQGQIIGGRPGKGFLLGLIFIAYFTVSLLLGGSEIDFKMPTFLSISLSCAAGIGEELCFRGLLLGTLMRQWKDDHRKMMIAVLLSSAAFGAMHLSNIDAGADVFVSVMQAVSSFFFGVAVAALYIRSGNLLAPMFYHALTDIIAFATNLAMTDSGVVSGTYKVGDAIDDVFCFILMIIGLWMLRSGVFEEIREVWDQKWKLKSSSRKPDRMNTRRNVPMVKKWLIGFITALMICIMVPAAVFAEGNGVTGKLPKRTILVYMCGSNLESKYGMASFNLRQILESNYSKNEKVKVVVMTGGSGQWYLEDEKLVFPAAGVNVPDDAVTDDEGHILDPRSQISNCYNQIWEAKGADAVFNAGKLVLLDGDGISNVKSEDELMTDPGTLKAFINYGVEHYPADKYDLILWDHGGGSTGGFGADDHGMQGVSMSFPGIVDAIRDNAVTNRADNDPANDGSFDFIDFDACLMSCIDAQLVMADYTDYYIASAETEPGYGQYYTGWLDTLGENPDTNAFKLGKQMVDDYVSFYEKGLGRGQQGTLAVVDTKKFINSGITGALSDMSRLLKQQAQDGLFYDEAHSSKDAIKYGAVNFFDLGNFASMVSVVDSEVSEEDLEGDDTLDLDNKYTEQNITKRICSVLQNQDIIYARGTNGIKSKNMVYRNTDGSIDVGDLFTSGISFYFIAADNERGVEDFIGYYDNVAKAIKMMPDKNDGRYQFLKSYKDNLIDYAFITVTGNAVNRLINNEGKAKDEIDYDTVKQYLMGDNPDDPYSNWSLMMKPLLEKCGGETEARTAWLNSIVRQQAAEAVDHQNVTAKKVKEKNGIGHKIRIDKTRNRIIEHVQRNISLEVPAVNDYMAAHGEFAGESISFGSVEGTLDISSALQPGETISDIIRWYNGTQSDWILHAPEEKWYAIKDAEGNLHAAAIAKQDDRSITVAAACGEENNERHLTLTFEKGDQNNKLIEITEVIDKEHSRPIKPSELEEPVSLMPSLVVSGRRGGAFVNLYVPTSEKRFALSAENADGISLVYTDISKIKDIRDTDGDGTALHSSFSIRDMYGGLIDISDVVNPADEEVIDITLARAKPAVYTGRNLTPEIAYLGETLKNGTDYTWELMDSSDRELNQPGEYYLLVAGKGRFTGVDLKTFYIVSEESAAQVLVDQAQAEYDAAMAAMDEAVTTGDNGLLQTVYTRLVNAQNALLEAKDMLASVRDMLAAEQQAELEDRINDLDKKIENLTEQLSEAIVIDISNYQVNMKTSMVYTGKPVKPAVKVSGLPAGAYKVAYSSNTKVGTGKVTIKANSPAYKGTITRSFKIAPKKAVIAKIKAGKRKLTVRMKTTVAKTGGRTYQIRYRIKGELKWRTLKTKKRTVTIRRLKKGKKYQIKVRACKTVKGVTYYGAWSKIRTSKKIKK